MEKMNEISTLKKLYLNVFNKALKQDNLEYIMIVIEKGSFIKILPGDILEEIDWSILHDNIILDSLRVLPNTISFKTKLESNKYYIFSVDVEKINGLEFKFKKKKVKKKNVK